MAKPAVTLPPGELMYLKCIYDFTHHVQIRTSICFALTITVFLHVDWLLCGLGLKEKQLCDNYAGYIIVNRAHQTDDPVL